VNYYLNIQVHVKLLLIYVKPFNLTMEDRFSMTTYSTLSCKRCVSIYYIADVSNIPVILYLEFWPQLQKYQVNLSF